MFAINCICTQFWPSVRWKCQKNLHQLHLKYRRLSTEHLLELPKPRLLAFSVRCNLQIYLVTKKYFHRESMGHKIRDTLVRTKREMSFNSTFWWPFQKMQVNNISMGQQLNYCTLVFSANILLQRDKTLNLSQTLR